MAAVSDNGYDRLLKQGTAQTEVQAECGVRSERKLLHLRYLPHCMTFNLIFPTQYG